MQLSFCDLSFCRLGLYPVVSFRDYPLKRIYAEALESLLRGILICMEKLPPTILVIFGITGDLSRRYLLPALAEICRSDQLSKDFQILGVSRRDVNMDEIFSGEQKVLQPYSQIFKMDLADGAHYQKLKHQIGELKQKFDQPPQVIFYLSVPPVAARQIIELLGHAGLNQLHMKLLLEKPFGNDLKSAEELVAETAKYFPEEQVYRIDHYLAKEMAQNITVFLGSNSIFRDVWSAQFIEDIEIVAAEKIGIEGRASFYESTGALRDIVQSHLLQLAALTLMEPCSDIFDFDEIPKRRLAALKMVEPVPKDKCQERAVRAQYEGYAKEVNNPGTQVETFAAITLYSTDPRWQAVPIRLITGKNLDQKLTEIRVSFKKTSAKASNQLVFRIQPKEGIEIDLLVKEPGYERKLQNRQLSFEYDLESGRLPDAYEQVLVDAMRGNHSLFASSDEVLASWQILQPVLDCWSMDSSDLKTYKPSSTIEEAMGGPTLDKSR